MIKSHFPATNKIYWAEKGQGAYCIEGNDLEHKIEKTSSVPNYEMKYAMVNTSIRGFGQAAQMDMMNYIIAHDISHRNTGSVATMLCHSAVNDNHVSVITAAEYDIAAGLLIAQEAGADIKRFDYARDQEPYTALIVTKNQHALGVLNNQIQQSLKKGNVTGLTFR